MSDDIDNGNNGGDNEEYIKERPVGPGMGDEVVVRLCHADIFQPENHTSDHYGTEHLQTEEAEQESFEISSHDFSL